MRKHYGSEIHELMCRDNATHLNMVKKVKELGHKIHSALPLVHILGGTDFLLAGEVNWRDMPVSCVVRTLLLLEQCPVPVFKSQNSQGSFQHSRIPCCCQMKAMLSTHTRKQMNFSFSILLSEVQMGTALISQYKSFPSHPFNFLSSSFRHLPMWKSEIIFLWIIILGGVET